MWALFLLGYAFIAALATAAARVALTCRNEARREMAYRVLKLVWGSGAAGVLLAIADRLPGFS